MAREALSNVFSFISVLKGESEMALVKPDYVADCLFDPNAPTKPLCIVGRKGTGGAALLEIGKGEM